MSASTKRNARRAPGASVETEQQRSANPTAVAPLAQAEEPEHGNDRRAFLIWACMLGAVKPERVVERIIAEIEQESAT